mgnify:FL=1|jgi:hypothetical protein
METRKCTRCEKTIIGRSDKRFCSDACRIDYHNQQRRELYEGRKHIHQTINRNRQVLQSLYERGALVLTQEELLANGFSFSGITGIACEKSHLELFCYDFRILQKGKKYRLSIMKSC